MATTTKPLALNESLNTTENTPRNIANVLADELSNLANAVKPDAEDIPYDNTTSGLSADDVQEAIDEIDGVVDTLPCLVITKSSVSSLPVTITNSAITDDMVCVNSTLSNPSAQLSDWTVTTSSGSVSISGTISGTTNIILYLSKSR